MFVFAVFAASAQEVEHRPAPVRPAADPAAENRRLLVLTAHQFAYILDVKKTIESFPPAVREPVSEPVPENR